MNRSLFVKYFIVFAAVSAVIAGLVLQIRSGRIQEHLEAEKELVGTTMNTIVDSLKGRSDILYYNRILEPEVVSLFGRAARTSGKAQDELRSELYQRLLPMYRNINLYHLKQLHFHLPDNTSFLRFHRPEKYGDNLGDVRLTVAYVNRTRKPIAGFEEGRIFSGYRFVYPVFDAFGYVGSVEMSISMKTILEMIRKNLGADVDFVIRKDVVASKVFESERSNYAVSDVGNGFLVEKDVLDLRSDATARLVRRYPGGERRLESALAAGEAVSFYALEEGRYYIVTFLPVNNAVTEQTVGYVIVDRAHRDMEYMIVQPAVLIAFSTILLAVLFFLLYRSKVQQIRIRSDRSELRSLLDLQKNIVILTDGSKLEYVNKIFFDYFRFASFQEFIRRHGCICDLFAEDDRCFHMGKVEEGDNWLETMMRLPATKRIVSMTDAKGVQRVFTVAINAIGSAKYIAVFTDISLTMSDQLELEKKATKDKLTGANNREFLDSNFPRIEQAAKSRGKLLGVILFDIDRFKQVNDTFGHARGDAVLRQYVQTVRQAIRQEDHIIRWGGEEFLLLCMVDSIENVVFIADNLRKRIENEPFEKVGRITSSFGGTVHQAGESYEQTIQRADKAMYRAKALGRNRVSGLAPDGGLS